MLDLPKTKEEFYESQTKEQLIIFLLNGNYENELLREKLGMLTGCTRFGDCDGMNGSCVDCCYNNPTLNMQCSQFQGTFTRMLRERENNKNKV